MSINHFPQEKLATFHAMNQSAIGIDVHSNLIVGVYQSSSVESCVDDPNKARNNFGSTFLKSNPNLTPQKLKILS